jgi:arylsulfatase A-like enzyme
VVVGFATPGRPPHPPQITGTSLTQIGAFETLVSPSIMNQIKTPRPELSSSPFIALAFLMFLTAWLPFGYSRAPNIIIILADDMGYGDLGVTGTTQLRTPHLDQLARSGVLCTEGYVASAVCSPSRAGLLTGRDPRRFGYEGNLNKGDSKYATRPELLGLPPGELTLGDHLRSAGYATALIGKWHQGIGPGFHPNARGFDYFCGMLGGSHSYFPTQAPHSIERNGSPVTAFPDPYLTDFFTTEGLAWMQQQQQADRPWFVFMSYNAPHGPMQATAADLAQFDHITDPTRRTYAAMMWALDRSVGRIHDWLKQSNQLENTLIVFFSDNGGPDNNWSWNGPFSGGKGGLREGGIRVPLIWSWPGTLPANQRFHSPVSALDLLPTFLAAAQSNPLPLRGPLSHEDARNFDRGVKRYGAYDGHDLLPALRGDATPPSRALFWRLQGQAAVRSGDLKLVRLSHRPAQVFTPSTDLAEANDLASSDAAITAQLFRELAEWESMLPTVPLWDSSPFWFKESAENYDDRPASPEPR